MTFKHVKFEDSAVMRSLEKVAKAKGWATEESLTKTASKKTDLSATANFTENILKLCVGLRQSGFNKYADELENKFVAYKQATTLYETSSEKGEDLVDRAHPKGSHHLENVDADEAVFETILDQHVKNLKMIDKVPTGKLASSRDILRAVKVVLAQDAEEEQMMPLRADKAIMQLNTVLSILNKCKSTVLNKMNTTTLAKSFDTNYGEISATVGALGKDTPPNVFLKQINSVLSDLEDIKKSVRFFNWSDLSALVPFVGPLIALVKHTGDIADIAGGNWEGALRDKITSSIDQAKAAANKARSYVIGEVDAELKGAGTNQPPQTKSNPTLDKITSAEQSLAGLIPFVRMHERGADPKEIQEIEKWIKETTDDLTDLKKTYANMSPQDAETNLAEIVKDFAQVRKDWS